MITYFHFFVQIECGSTGFLKKTYLDNELTNIFWAEKKLTKQGMELKMSWSGDVYSS